MTGPSRHLLTAVLFGLGIAGCGASQSGLDSSAGAQTRPAARTSSVQKAASQFVWHSRSFDINAGHTASQVNPCERGQTAISGGYRTVETGPNITILDSSPSDNGRSWVIVARNTGDKKESLEFFYLCAA